VAAAPRPAAAGVFTLFAEAHGGAVVGKGTSGDVVKSTVDAAFFEKAKHGAYGALIGAEFLFLDAWVQHHQFTNGKSIATWTQFGLGVHSQIALGDGKQQKEGKGGFVEFGAGAWFGIGTGQQVMPPLSNDEVTDKAFMLEGRLGVGSHMSKVFDVGILVPVSYGYFFKSGSGAVANDLSTHYRSVQGEALLYLRANLRLL
jgi:hypothetical protein